MSELTITVRPIDWVRYADENSADLQYQLLPSLASPPPSSPPRRPYRSCLGGHSEQENAEKGVLERSVSLLEFTYGVY